MNACLEKFLPSQFLISLTTIVRINLFNLLKLIHRQDEFITIINFIGINRLLPPSNIPLEIKRTLITKKERVNFTNDYHSSQARIIYLDREQHGSSFKVRIDRGENIDGGREKKLVERGRGRERESVASRDGMKSQFQRRRCSKMEHARSRKRVAVTEERELTSVRRHYFKLRRKT